MELLKEWQGIWKSLRVYRMDSGHAIALDNLYRNFVGHDELAFDIGAHVGDRTASFRRLGARVVALEPQKTCARVLKLLHGFDFGVTIVESAVSDREGKLNFAVNSANPTVSTVSREFVEAANAGAKGWEGQVWDKVIEVPATTLDHLIAIHGEPAFIKIDVEGAEEQVLRGLSRPVAALSFEFTTIQRAVAYACLARCVELGYRRFNVSLGESQRMTFTAPIDVQAMCQHIADLPHEANSGDIYALADNWKAGRSNAMF